MNLLLPAMPVSCQRAGTQFNLQTLFWIFPPYSEFFHALLPLLFFVSGAVSYGSYLRSQSGYNYLYRRVVSITAPYYVIVVLSLLFGYLFGLNQSAMTLDSAWRLLRIVPQSGDVFFPVGQVWFIHALVIISVLSLPVFKWSKNNIFWLAMPIIISLVIGVFEFNSTIYRSFFVAGHNLYQPIVNVGFFFLGAVYISQENHPKLLLLSAFSVVVLALAAAAMPLLFGAKIGLAGHSYAPDIYYISCSLVAIGVVIMMRNFILVVIYEFKRLKVVLDFISTHAYSIFMSHSFFIFACEKWLGLVSVKGAPLEALAKITIVLGASLITAPLLSMLTKKFSAALLPSRRSGPA